MKDSTINAKIIQADNHTIISNYKFYEIPVVGDYIRVDGKYYKVVARIFDYNEVSGRIIELKVR